MDAFSRKAFTTLATPGNATRRKRLPCSSSGSGQYFDRALTSIAVARPLWLIVVIDQREVAHHLL
jgi:hypothetical protein